MKHGLLGEYRFTGKKGALDYARQTGCIQFDPVDACGKNAELVFQSRVKGFTKEMLHDLLYKDRALFDYPDKNLSIIPTEYWPYFSRFRTLAREHGKRYPEMKGFEEQALAYIREHGEVSSDSLPIDGEILWHSAIHWSGTSQKASAAARAALEQLYSDGTLVISRKNGTRKFYDLAERHIAADILTAPDPNKDDDDFQKWRVLRRIGAVGLLWNRASDAFLYIDNLTAQRRNEIFGQLSDEGRIAAIQVEGITGALYCAAEDLPLAETVKTAEYKPRCEFIAPLDCFMWDRKLIKALFGFSYAWEIYTPEKDRKYGYYVLPVIYGDRFAARIEAVNNRAEKELQVRRIWYEEDVKQTKKLESAVLSRVNKFAAFNHCERVSVSW